MYVARDLTYIYTIIVMLKRSIKNSWLTFIGVLLLTLCLLPACTFDVATDYPAELKTAPASTEKTTTGLVEGTVIDVVDNTVIRLTVAGTEHKVRYIGIDTLVPYKHTMPLEYYYEKCHDKNKELVQNKIVRLEKDGLSPGHEILRPAGQITARSSK
jgi:endonuclease YncB( thermonuclease family)